MRLLMASFAVWLMTACAGPAGLTDPARGSSAAWVLDPGYYWQSVTGHLAVIHAARPVAQWVADPATSEPLRQRLLQSQSIRAYASEVLRLPDNPSYRRYADLGRPYVVWNVVAAPPDDLALKRWCFPFAGCVGYRGYYREQQARALAAELAAQGWEVSVYGVAAYSTLGWLNVLGGDPLLSTFIGQPLGDVARLVFHELAHQNLYAKDDTGFNEGYATAVERLGVRQWLRTQPPVVQQQYVRAQDRRQAFRDLSARTRAALAALYEQARADPQVRQTLGPRRAEIMARFRDAYQPLRERLTQELAGNPRAPVLLAFYDEWVREANNATFAVQAAYEDRADAFEVLFEQEAGDWDRFHAAARALAQLPRDQREDALQALQGKRSTASAGRSQ